MQKIFLFIILCVNTAFSQPTLEWAARYSLSSGNLYLLNAAIDNNENIYFTGYDDFNNILVKYNTTGTMLWSKSYPNARAYAIKVDNFGNIYLGGCNHSFNYGDFWVIKYNPEGNVVWENSFSNNGNPSNDCCLDLIIDNAGIVYATGYTSLAGSFEDYCTVKYNSDGTRNWVKTFHYSIDYFDLAKSITLDNNNNILVTGEVFDSNSTQNYCTIKYNANGELIWYRTLSGFVYEAEKIISVGQDIFVTGRAGSVIGTICYNSSGNQQWIQYVQNGFYSDMVLDNSQSPVITGQLYDSTLQRISLLMLKYNNSGNLLWSAGFTSGSYSSGKSLSFDENDNLYVLGSGNFGYDNHLLTLKYSNTGVLLWQQQYSVVSDSFYTPVKIHYKNNKIYTVANATWVDGLRREAIIIKYSQTMGINTISSETPSQFSLSQNYPNPFNPTTNFEFSIPQAEFVNLTIYDAVGRIVETLHNGELKSGIYKANWNASNFPSGVYFYRLSAGSFTGTKKMVLIK